jgi:hypothetical protein
MKNNYLPLICASFLGLAGLESRADDFVSGVVKGERFDDGIYYFTLDVAKEFKIFVCRNAYGSGRLDSLINSGDKVKVKIDSQAGNIYDWSQPQRASDKELQITASQVVEVNDKKVSLED